MEPGVLCPNGTLEAIARSEMHDAAALAGLPDLRAWQRDALGVSRILSAVQAPPGAADQSPR
jgi:hypothetical protein